MRSMLNLIEDTVSEDADLAEYLSHGGENGVRDMAFMMSSATHMIVFGALNMLQERGGGDALRAERANPAAITRLGGAYDQIHLEAIVDAALHLIHSATPKERAACMHSLLSLATLYSVQDPLGASEQSRLTEMWRVMLNKSAAPDSDTARDMAHDMTTLVRMAFHPALRLGDNNGSNKKRPLLH